MDGNIDKVREALKEARDDFKTLAHSHDGDFDEAGLRSFGSICERQMDEAIAALSAIDPEAIRAEARAEGIRLAADRARRYLDGLPYYEGCYTNGLHAAILGAEPAQDDGKPEVGDVVAFSYNTRINVRLALLQEPHSEAKP